MGRFVGILAFSVLAMLIAGCAQEGGQAPADNATNAIGATGAGGTVMPGTVTVTIQNFEFSPQTVNIKSGSKVVWTNKDSAAHQVVNDARAGAGVGELFNSQMLESGEKYSFIFSQEGEFEYYCFLHPNMRGTIIVEK